MDNKDLQILSGVFAGLSSRLRLISSDGKCLLPDDGHPFTPPSYAVARSVNHRMGENLVRVPDVESEMYLVLPAQTPGAEDLLQMADALIASLQKVGSARDTVYRGILTGELTGPELVEKASGMNTSLILPARVLLFKVNHAEKQRAYELLGEILPLSENDVLVEVGRSAAALIKNLSDTDEPEEISQYAMAVLSTLLEETGRSALVGIGEPTDALQGLYESCRQAAQAIEIGRVFYPARNVHRYDSMRLERFLYSIPAREAEKYYSLLFGSESVKALLNEEMLQTIEMFFEKDLNLSDTARQMFIHRNTLVYRLEKVQRAMGLDLRRFDDAVTFKILYELRKCISSGRKSAEEERRDK